MKYDELEKIVQLRDTGVLTEEEFQREKAKILDDSKVFQKFSAGEPLFGLKEDHYCALIHFSQFLAYILPVLGIAVPITLWILGKNSSQKADIAGRNSFDWILSALIYIVIAGILTFVFIGVPLLIAVIICAIVFPIVAGVKAFDGETWRYPLSIHFFTENPKKTPEKTSRQKEYSAKPDKDAHFSRRKYD